MPSFKDSPPARQIEADASPAARPPLTEAAKRALAEAKARRLAAGPSAPLVREVHGRKGPEPVRYGDWEVKGLASDF